MKTKKIIAIASAVILAVSSLAGCGGNNKKVEEGNITLTAYDKNVTTSFGNDDVSSEIIKKTGVTLDYNQASGDAKEKLKMRKQQGIGFEADLIYVSPMIRCRDTADLLFPEQRKVPWDGLQETDFGDFEYKNYKELKDDPLYQAWIDSNGQMLIPNGESGTDFRRRCCAAYERCVAEAREKGLEKIAIVCHGGTIMSVMERYGVPKKSFYEWQVANGCDGNDRRRGKRIWYSGN